MTFLSFLLSLGSKARVALHLQERSRMAFVLLLVVAFLSLGSRGEYTCDIYNVNLPLFLAPKVPGIWYTVIPNRFFTILV